MLEEENSYLRTIVSKLNTQNHALNHRLTHSERQLEAELALREDIEAELSLVKQEIFNLQHNSPKLVQATEAFLENLSQNQENFECFSHFVKDSRQFLQMISENDLAKPVLQLLKLVEYCFDNRQETLSESTMQNLALYNLQLAELHRELHDKILHSPRRTKAPSRHKKTSSLQHHPFALASDPLFKH